MRNIGVVTVARSDYGIYLPILRRIQADPELHLQLLVSGMHLSPEFGLTREVIDADGFEISEVVEMLLSTDSAVGIAKSIGLGLIGFAQAFSHVRPDLLMVLGDRFEMHAAALAALPLRIPVAHIHGGELTGGAIDDALRHSITKLSHLHFATTEQYMRRIIQLGEEPWRVTNCGAPSLDNLTDLTLLTISELKQRFGLRIEEAPLLVTYHTVTLEYEQTRAQISELLSALEASRMPIVFTASNADTKGHLINKMIKHFVQRCEAAQFVDNLGTQGYFSLMASSSALVGNTSSGIIEAASFKLPVVNIGSRQEGRVRAENVIDVGYDRHEIVEGIRKAVDPTFLSSLANLVNPYGPRQAADKIVSRIKNVPIDQKLVAKRFFDSEQSRTG